VFETTETCPFCNEPRVHQFTYSRRIMRVTWYACGHELREVFDRLPMSYFGVALTVKLVRAEWFQRWPPPRRGLSAIRARVADGDKYGRPGWEELTASAFNVPCHELAEWGAK